MADHAQLTADTGCQCRPKAGDPNTYDQQALHAIADRLNNRPGAVLGSRTPPTPSP